MDNLNGFIEPLNEFIQLGFVNLVKDDNGRIRLSVPEYNDEFLNNVENKLKTESL